MSDAELVTQQAPIGPRAGRCRSRVTSVVSGFRRRSVAPAPGGPEAAPAEPEAGRPARRDHREWSDELGADGSHLLGLHLAAATWTTARTDRYTASYGDGLHRVTTLSVDLDADRVALLPSWRDRRLLPISAVGPTRPGQLTAHQDGDRVQLIGGRHERSLVAAAITAAIVTSGDGGPPARTYGEVLAALAADPGEDPVADHIGSWPPAAAELVRAWRDTQLLLAAVAVPDDAPENGWRTELTIEARLPLGTPDDRVALADELVGEARALVRRARRARPAATPPLRRLEATELDDLRLRIPVERLAACGRYRVELDAPREVVVARSALVVATFDTATAVLPSTEVVVGERHDGGSRTTIDKAVPSDWSDPTSPTLVDAHIDVVLRPRRAPHLPAAACIEGACAAGLTLAPAATGRVVGPGVVAAVLVVLTLVAARRARRLDRRLTHTVAASSRHRVVVSAAATALGAAIAVVGASGPPAAFALGALALAAWLVAVPAMVSHLHTRDRSRDLRTAVRSERGRSDEPMRWTRIDKSLRT
ncbi:MAG: hypothetical protein S0880_24145 [Actinomycetota bacterium]|nr:hypothetical protein [Actinomycetota bacterium]